MVIVMVIYFIIVCGNEVWSTPQSNQKQQSVAATAMRSTRTGAFPSALLTHYSN